MNGRADLDHPAWDNGDRALGQLFVMGFDGVAVSPHVRALIQDHHVGSILLTAKNLTSAQDTARLVRELQHIAHDAGHPVPLAIAVDQEHGGVNSLYDEAYIRQFPSAMGLAATGSTQLAHQVAKASAAELAACGINWIFGPCLDTLSSARNQPLGVRAFCDDPHQVSRFGNAMIRGYHDAGLLCMGKHFPSYGNLEFLGSSHEVPTITDSIDQLRASALVPFAKAVGHGLDAVMVGGCAMSSPELNVTHACLSPQVVTKLLREDLQFDGVVVSECLEMEALSQSIGIGNGTIMAVEAGCDLLLLCRSPPVQQEAIDGLKLGVSNGTISLDRTRQALGRVLRMKSSSSTCNWQHALNPPGLATLMTLQPSHAELSTRAYNESITVVRDERQLLPLTKTVPRTDELLILTPLVKPLAASATSLAMAQHADGGSTSPESTTTTTTGQRGRVEKPAAVMSGESVFRALGQSLAQQHSGRVLHTSYTGNGVRPVHENLIGRASCVVVVVADATRHLYQHAFAKHAGMLCKSQGDKAFIVVAVSSPYDFALDTASVGTYICTYDFTDTALRSLAGVLLYGQVPGTGRLPGSISKSQKLSSSRQSWLVERYDAPRDAHGLTALIHAVAAKQQRVMPSALEGVSSATFALGLAGAEEQHLVVRNNSTRALYGFCATYYFGATATGVLAAVLVDPSRRRQSIGASLHNQALRGLLQRPGVERVQVGSGLPSVYLGAPSEGLLGWFGSLGWSGAAERRVVGMVHRGLQAWRPPEGLARRLQSAQATVEFDLVYGDEFRDAITAHVAAHGRGSEAGVYALALGEPSACGVIRARRQADGACLGTLVLCTRQSRLAQHLPALRAGGGEGAGGMAAAVVAGARGGGGGGGGDEQQAALVLASMVLLGLRQIKQQGCGACVLAGVDEQWAPALADMGFGTESAASELSSARGDWLRAPH